MFSNYFKTSWRNLRTHKSYSVINIFGLAVGLATTLIIFLVIHYELTYDNFQSNGDRICRVVTDYINPSNGEVTGHESGVPITLYTALRNDFSNLEEVAPVWNIGGAQIHIPISGKDFSEERRVKENDGLYFTEPSLFKIFDYTWLIGNADRLNEPNTVVLNQTLANTFFGDWRKAMGQTIQMWSYRIPLQVVGVFKDLPVNTDMEIKMAASHATFRNITPDFFKRNDWETIPWSSECFLLLPKGSNAVRFK